MSKSLLAFPGTVAMAIVLVLAGSGCATTPGNSLDAQQDSMVRRLAGQCYWEHEGARLIYGGLQVYSACREWATRQVRVSIPGG